MVTAVPERSIVARLKNAAILTQSKIVLALSDLWHCCTGRPSLQKQILQKRILRPLAALLLSACGFVGSGGFAAEPAPPAAAAIPSGGPPTPFAAPAETPIAVQRAPALQYTEVTPGLLERSVYQATAAGVTIDDILVAPGESVQIAADQFAALLEIKAGAPQVSVDGKSVTTEPGKLVGIDQGHTLTIDNRQAQRGIVARLFKIRAQGN